LHDNFKPLLNDLTLWLNQLLPIYWLLGAILLGLIVLGVTSVRNRRKVTALNDERQALSLDRASNQQKIELLESNNQQLSSQVERSLA